MKKFSTKSFIMKVFILMICLLTCGFTVFNPVSIKKTPSEICTKEIAYGLPTVKDIFKNLFHKEDVAVNENKEKVYVYLGGFPLGFAISCSGVLVVAKSNDSASEINVGDVITHIDGTKVSSAEQILKLINSEKYAGKTITVSVKRNDKTFETSITPVFDDLQKIYKLGLWIRDNAAGVGTITYIRKDNLRFGALGHPVCDIDTGTCLPVNSGNIFKCNIVGYKKGAKGNPGELKGLFLRNGSILGNLDANNKFGVYGNFNEKFLENYSNELVEVAGRNEVKSGKAKIRCTIDGTTPKDYDIEIVKTYFQSSKDNKSMFIRVTDKELISKTGGIVQGMSGSPIIQNGKLVGAVTHVFVSDATKGYGVYADWMIDN
jgi:stage IV sporulation protein B